MGQDDLLCCENCQRTDGDFLDPLAGPEYDECCDAILCEPCWTADHVAILR